MTFQKKTIADVDQVRLDWYDARTNSYISGQGFFFNEPKTCVLSEHGLSIGTKEYGTAEVFVPNHTPGWKTIYKFRFKGDKPTVEEVN
jgi:hypothetical protein